MTDTLQIWTVYDHPADCPDLYVARLSVVDGSGPVPTMAVMSAGDLETLRASLASLGLTRLTRAPEDHPKILEVWL